MAEKERLDVLLINKGLAESRELAKAYIMAGNVYVDGMKENKAGTKVDILADIQVKNDGMRFVSRGGYKLEKAMKVFPIKLDGRICMDVGASTGGFTDCMLQSGAKKVYSIDVGRGQLAWKLRNDPRVICLEKTNMRYITKEQVPDLVDFSSIDVSFISLTKVLPATFSVMEEHGEVVALIKPQFEAGREKIGKKGVVRDKKVHLEVIIKIIDFIIDNQAGVMGLDYSPIKGPEGNIEYLIFITKNTVGYSAQQAYDMARLITEASHEELDS